MPTHNGGCYRPFPPAAPHYPSSGLALYHNMLRPNLSSCALAVLGSLLGATALIAQVPAPANRLPAVEVTGTRLPRLLAESPAAATVITREELANSGRTSLGQLLLELPEFGGTAVTDMIAINSVHGVAAADLRGLGAGNTLVLIDGRRITTAANTYGDTVFVDMNSVPPGLIERVEILKGGASAVYGADAVAGVINIVLRRRPTGGELRIGYGNTFDRDAAELSASLVAGATRGRLSVTASAAALDRHALASRDRDFSRTANLAPRFAATYAEFGSKPAAQLAGYDGRSLTAPNARISLVTGQRNGVNGVAIPSLAANANITALPGTGGVPAGTLSLAVPSYTAPFASTTGGAFTANGAAAFVAPEVTRTDPAARNLYNFNDAIWLSPEARRLGGGLHIDLASAAAGPALFADLRAQRNRSHTEFFPVGITAPVPKTNPWNPFGVDVTAQWRITDFGPRHSKYADETVAALAGVRSPDGARFNWETAVAWSRNTYVDTTTNAARASLVRAALAATTRTAALNPFGGQNFRQDAALIESLKFKPWTAGDADLLTFDARASGELYRTRAGAILGSVYAETRRERLGASSDPLLQAGEALGQGQTGADGDWSRRVYAGAAEVRAPLVRGATAESSPLVLEAASRWESATGGFRSGGRPTLGLLARPGAGLALRASHAWTFRAPTLPQLFAPQSEGYANSMPDPRRPAALTGDDYDGPNVSRLLRGGGNPSLKAEKGRSLQLGATWEPRSARGLTLETTWFRYDLENLITGVGGAYVLDNELNGLGWLVTREAGSTTYVNRTAAPIAVLSGPNGAKTSVAPGASATVPGRLVRIDSYTINLSRQRLVGADFAARYTRDFGSLGRWTTAAALTATDESSYAYDKFTPLINGASGGSRWRARGTLDWARGVWSAGAAMQYIGSAGSHANLNYQKPYRPVQVHIGWTAPEQSWLRGTRFSLGVDDVFAETTPLYNDPPIGYNAYVVARPQGRFWRVAATTTW